MTAAAVTPSIDPTKAATTAAISGYYKGRKTMAAMAAEPRASLAEYPASLGVTEHLGPPALDDAVKVGQAYAQAGVRLVYDLGLSTPTVTRVDLKAGRVELAHCGADEKVTMYQGGKSSATKPGPGEAPWPHLTRYVMTQTGGRWLLTDTLPNATKTCHTDRG